MPDDLEALLRRTAEPLVPSYVLDPLVTRLAEVVIDHDHWESGWEQHAHKVETERNAARKAEAEAVELVATLWTRHGHSQTCPVVTDLGTSAVPRWVCTCGWDEIARRVTAVMTGREEAIRG